MSDNNSFWNEFSDYKLHCAGKDIDDEGYFCTKNVYVANYFSSDSEDYDFLSANAPKLSDWKETNSHVSVGFNNATKELHDQLRKELSHVTNKLKLACGSEIVSFEYLVHIEHGPDSEIIKSFMSSDAKTFKNKHDKCIQFLGTFLLCCSVGFSASYALKENSIVHRKLVHEVKIKLMTYEEHMCAWNEISKIGLKHDRMPNHEIITSPGIILF